MEAPLLQKNRTDIQPSVLIIRYERLVDMGIKLGSFLAQGDERKMLSAVRSWGWETEVMT